VSQEVATSQTTSLTTSDCDADVRLLPCAAAAAAAAAAAVVVTTADDTIVADVCMRLAAVDASVSVKRGRVAELVVLVQCCQMSCY
jgi:hypothetical protein